MVCSDGVGDDNDDDDNDDKPFSATESKKSLISFNDRFALISFNDRFALSFLVSERKSA